MAKVDPNKPQEVTTLRVQDFSGGLNTAVSPSLLNANEGQLANNVNFDQKGTVQPQKGRRKRYAADFGASPVVGLGAFYTKAGLANLVIASGTSLYTDQPHMDHIWDTQANWKAAGTVFEGLATADRTTGSLTTEVGGPRVNEVQTVTISGAPTGGNFKLTFSGQTTADIPYNASALQVHTALLALSNIGGASEVQTVTITGSPTGGTFTLTLGGQTTPALAYNATASAVQSALEALSTIGAGNVTVTLAGSVYTCSFQGTKAFFDMAQMTATSSLTGGTSPAVTIATTTPGAPPDIDTQGNAGGPWTITFQNALGYADQPLMTATHTLTGGTAPSVTIIETTKGYNLDLSVVTTLDVDWNAGTLTKVLTSANNLSLALKGPATGGDTINTQAEWDAGTKDSISVSAGGVVTIAVAAVAKNINRTLPFTYMESQTNTAATGTSGITLLKV
jgi:hypothetical protein